MVTENENEIMTRVGPGAPGGELLRRYWQPVAASAELTDEEPIMEVRLLGEDLALYKDLGGNYGLVGRQCPHRMASLGYGRVEADGIRCSYHGWKFDCAGNCTETPAEPANSRVKDSVHLTAYPVRRLGGVLFAYMGPEPVPALPRWDVLAWEHGQRWIVKHKTLGCNWLQCMENSVDPSHLYWLHGATAHLANVVDHYEEKHDFITFEHGIMKRRTTPAQKPGAAPQVDQHPLLFPNTLRHVGKNRKTGGHRHNLQFRIPIDDTHTQVLVANFEPTPGEHSPADGDAPVEYFDFLDECGRYKMDHVFAQDFMAWETQGPIHDRTTEQLGAADKGIVILRRLLREQIEVVQGGGTPMGVTAAERQSPIIELDVINERIGLMAPERQGAA